MLVYDFRLASNVGARGHYARIRRKARAPAGQPLGSATGKPNRSSHFLARLPAGAGEGREQVQRNREHTVLGYECVCSTSGRRPATFPKKQKCRRFPIAEL